MFYRLPRWPVVTLALLGGGFSARAEDPDAIFGDNPAPAAKPAEESARPPLRSGKAAIEQALQQPAELELFQTPIDLVVNLLKDDHGIEIQMDRKALDDAGIGACTMITRSLRGVPLNKALNLMLADVELTWLVKDDVLLITTPAVARKSCYLETYDVSDLVGLGDEKGGPAAAGERLAGTIAASMPRPDGNRGAPKPGAIACSTFGTVTLLTTTQNREAHEHIAQWLADVRSKLAEKRPAAEVKKKRDRHAAEASITEALKQKVSVNYVKEPLESVLRDLGRKCKIAIRLDKEGLRGVCVSTDAPVTIHVKDVSLRSALRRILHEFDLTYMITDYVLLITVPEPADRCGPTKVYPVADLVLPTAGAAKPSATSRKQKADRPVRAEQAIRKALRQKASADYVEESLVDVVSDLQERFKINIQIDQAALDNVNFRPETPITRRVKDVSLESLLGLILDELDLAFCIKHEVLLITTPEFVEEALTTRVYDVADLVVCRNRDGELWDDYEPLRDAITAAVRPASWDDAGGQGTIQGGTFRGAKVLIVSHRREVHEELVSLLAKLRAVERRTTNAPPPRRDPPEPTAGINGMGMGGMGMGGMGGGFFGGSTLSRKRTAPQRPERRPEGE